ncbi:hypothetical protein D9M71_493690 [compost metagenome]
MSDHVAADFNHVFLLELGQVGFELAGDPPILGEYLQAAGALLQRRHVVEAGEVAFERAAALAVICGQAVDSDAVAGAFDVQIGRLVEQQGNRLQGFGAGTGLKLDLLLGHFELRLVDHRTVHGDPAAFDVQFGLPSGATDQFNEAFGKANGFRHDDSRRHRERCPL